jgi:DNA polymerase III subunit delta
MVAVKAADAESFVARPDPARPVVLVFGPDSGLVRERVDRIVQASVDDPRDPFALARLEGDDLSSDPSRLVEEAHTVPLFGGKRAVWVRAGSRSFVPAVETLLAGPPVECRVVIEAGDLRRNAPLRVVCEKSKFAAAVPCYADSARDVARLIDDEMRAAKLTISPDARAALISLIGGDRQASRGEIRKLALYAHGRNRVELDDVLAVVTDAATLALDAVIDATFAGRTQESESQLARVTAAGTSGGAIVAAAIRQVIPLHKARIAMDAGKSFEEAIGVFVPPLHFTRKALVETALRNWTAERLARAMEQLAQAARDIRRMRTPIDSLAEPLAQRALLSIATSARRRN